jgi:hypothetical protein
VFGALLKLSDLLQEHGYRWFPGAAVAVGALASALLLVVTWRASDVHRVFWLAVLLHWILRGRIDGLNHGLVTTAGLVWLWYLAPSLFTRDPLQFFYFFIPLTVLGLLHDRYQYTSLPGPAWLKEFFRNQHLYWYIIIVCHPLVSQLDVAFLVGGIAFVKGYGVFYSARGLALLPRVGISPPA